MATIPQISVVIGWELDSIEILAVETFDYFEKRARESDGDGRYANGHAGRTETKAMSSARQMGLECAMQQINNTVDGVILLVANRLQGDVSPTEMAKRIKARRSELVDEIETRLGISFATLPGWQGLMQLNDGVNALKHRFGVGLEPNSDGGFTMTRPARDLPAVTGYLEAGRTWTHALLQAAGAAEAEAKARDMSP